MQPHLALAYSSQGGSSWLGAGLRITTAAAEKERRLPLLNTSVRHLATFEAVTNLPDHAKAGVYNPAALSGYSYAQNSPTVVQDPDGEAAQVLTACFFGPIACSGAVVLLAVVSVGVLANMKGDSVVKAEEAKPDSADPDAHNPAQDKKLGPGEIDKLKKFLEGSGETVEQLKEGTTGGIPAGKLDLYKTPKGDIVVKPKHNPGNRGPGEPTGINVDDL